MIARSPCTVALLLTTFAVAPLGAQARVEAVIGAPDSAVGVQRLGASMAELVRAGTELLPGDMIATARDSVLVELSCALRDRISKYRLQAPFRVLIDVPADSICHVNILAGRADVLAETPTQTTAGGVTLGSSGTQYSVEVVRTERGGELRCVVYDGRMRVLSRRSGVQISAGTNLLWAADGSVRRQRNSRADLDTTAAIYARFDLAQAQRQRPLAAPPDTAFSQLKALHLEVLASPADTDKRVALAKRQLELNVRDQAVYNLRRVNITSDARLRAHNIDPAIVRRR